MNKEAVVHIHNGILLSHKKECIWLSYKGVDEPRAYYTEWNEWETDKYRILMHIYGIEGASLVTRVRKNLPAMQEIWVWSLDQEDPLEKGTAIHSSILAWRIPWTEAASRLQSMGWQRIRHDWATNTHTHMVSKKMMNQHEGQQWRCRRREQTCGHRGGKRGWDGLREQHWDIYISM